MSRRASRPRRPRFVGSAATALLVIALGLTGCTGAGSATGPSAAPSSSSTQRPASPSSTPTPTPAVLVPGGSASQNLPLFAAVVSAVWASPDNVSGRAYIDALSAAGFDRGAMQVTADETTIGQPAESIQFSVRWGEQCLLGQVGPSTGNPVTTVAPVLGDGTCLIGDTRPIDW